MDELFLEFEPKPVGAASIAQAHRATLLDGRPVIVKVRYQEVATLYAADFDNLEIVTSWLFPENMSLIRGLRQRHSAELDFRTEAANLAEVGANLRARGFEPHLVRIPCVPDARLCTRHVLAMEYLHGVSLASAIEDEYAEIADALGMGSAAELRSKLMRRVQQHFEGGGGAQRFVDTAEAAAPLVRAYAKIVRWRRGLVASLHQCLARIAALLGLGRHLPPPALLEPAGGSERQKTRSDLGRAIRTLVRVHGVAMLLDGVYNADPHPGNVLLLADGRLGLIVRLTSPAPLSALLGGCFPCFSALPLVHSWPSRARVCVAHDGPLCTGSPPCTGLWDGGPPRADGARGSLARRPRPRCR